MEYNNGMVRNLRRHLTEHEACQANARDWHCATREIPAKPDDERATLVRKEGIMHLFGAKRWLVVEKQGFAVNILLNFV
ncbi:MAG TPA: hypothetical protein VK642_16710 [Burkholderiales bacterium]|nr:hypothetical protein [Burkholderiales bacterium]